jgi:hypothetical protein
MSDNDYISVSRSLLNKAFADFRANQPKKFERLHYVLEKFCEQDFDEETFFRWALKKYSEDCKKETPWNCRQKMKWRFGYAGINEEHHWVMFTWLTGEARSQYAAYDAAVAAAAAPVASAAAAAPVASAAADAPVRAAGGAAGGAASRKRTRESDEDEDCVIVEPKQKKPDVVALEKPDVVVID